MRTVVNISDATDPSGNVFYSNPVTTAIVDRPTPVVRRFRFCEHCCEHCRCCDRCRCCEHCRRCERCWRGNSDGLENFAFSFSGEILPDFFD